MKILFKEHLLFSPIELSGYQADLPEKQQQQKNLIKTNWDLKFFPYSLLWVISFHIPKC